MNLNTLLGQGIGNMGVCFAAVCDLIVAADDTYFGLPEVKVAMAGGAAVTGMLVPDKVSRYMAYTGNYLRVQEVARYGNIHAVVRKERLMEECMVLAREITANYYKSVQYIKAGLSVTNDFHVEDKFQVERKYQHILTDDPMRDEMLNAFQEKRKPNFHS